MPLPQEITDQVWAIPVLSHSQAKKYITQFGKDSIIYYIKDPEEPSQPSNSNDGMEVPDQLQLANSNNAIKLSDSLFIYYSENDLTNESGMQLMEHAEIVINKEGHYLLNGGEYKSIPELLNQNNIKRNLVLKQNIIADYLNKQPANFESTFLPTRGNQYEPPYQWEVDYLRNWCQGENPPSAKTEDQFQVVMKKEVELIFSNREEDFQIYLNRINRLLGLSLTCGHAETTFYGYEGSSTTHYWQMNASHYNDLMQRSLQSQRAVPPTLKDLVFNKIFKEKKSSALTKNYHKYSIFEKAGEPILPADLLDDPRMAAHRKAICRISGRKK